VTRQQFAELDAALGFAAAPPPNVTVVRVLQDSVEIPPPWAYPTQPASSPRVPNPADLHPSAAASIGEVQQLIADSGVGTIKSMNPKTSLFPVVQNSTAETSALDAVVTLPKTIPQQVYRVVAGGVCRCTAGGPVNLTARLKRTSDDPDVTIIAAAVSLINDADGNRPWLFEVASEGNTAFADGLLSIARLTVGAGSGGAPLVQGLGQQILALAIPDTETWDLTLQFSVANAGILASIYTAQLTFALAEL
jgi:hypothetical protein